MISCDRCQNHVIWKSVPPRKPQFICQRCGHTWRIPRKEIACNFGVVEGDWSQEEMDQLNLSLLNTRCEKDWNVIKGRCVWSAFQTWWLERFIITDNLEDLIYWIEESRLNPHWWNKYIRQAK